MTPKVYVDSAIDEEISLFRNNQDNDFNNHNLTNINSFTLNTEAFKDDHVISKAYVSQFNNNIERNRRDLGLDFYNKSNDLRKNNQDKKFNDNSLTNTKSITISQKPTSDNQVAEKKYVDDSLGISNVSKFIQTLENYLKVFVVNDAFNLGKKDKKQITDITIIKADNTRSTVLPY